MAPPAHYALARTDEERALCLRIAERDDACRHAQSYRAALARAADAQHPVPTIMSLKAQVAAYEAQATAAQLVIDAITARTVEPL